MVCSSVRVVRPSSPLAPAFLHWCDRRLDSPVPALLDEGVGRGTLVGAHGLWGMSTVLRTRSRLTKPFEPTAGRLRRNKSPSKVRVQRLKDRTQSPKRLITELPDRPQRVGRRNPFFRVQHGQKRRLQHR
jgi:hypothetical protein